MPVDLVLVEINEVIPFWTHLRRLRGEVVGEGTGVGSSSKPEDPKVPQPVHVEGTFSFLGESRWYNSFMV